MIYLPPFGDDDDAATCLPMQPSRSSTMNFRECRPDQVDESLESGVQYGLSVGSAAATRSLADEKQGRGSRRSRRTGAREGASPCPVLATD
jgi:hypothetical protein